MTREQFNTFMDQTYRDQVRMTATAGQKEYARDVDNTFANFERVAADMGLTREQILWSYLMKHRDGVAAYLNGYVSQREPVQGRIKDMIVYLFLLWAMVEQNATKPLDLLKAQYEQLSLPL